MDDIILERNTTTVMKLDDDEQALLDEIEISPAVIRKSFFPAAATPIISEAVETNPSFAPSTAARNQPAR